MRHSIPTNQRVAFSQLTSNLPVITEFIVVRCALLSRETIR
jgi:hypothetical protein